MSRMSCLLPVLLCVFLSPHVLAQASAPEDREALATLLDEFLEGASRNDADVHQRFWADDLIYTRSAGVRIDKAELMKGVKSAPPPKPDEPRTAFTAADVRIQQYGDAAVVAFQLVGTTTTAEGKTEVANFLNTGTFIKRAGRWQAVAWQSTRVPAAEATAKP